MLFWGMWLTCWMLPLATHCYTPFTFKFKSLLANQQIESCSYQNTPDSNVQLGTFARGRDVCNYLIWMGAVLLGWPNYLTTLTVCNELCATDFFHQHFNLIIGRTIGAYKLMIIGRVMEGSSVKVFTVVFSVMGSISCWMSLCCTKWRLKYP